MCNFCHEILQEDDDLGKEVKVQSSCTFWRFRLSLAIVETTSFRLWSINDQAWWWWWDFSGKSFPGQGSFCKTFTTDSLSETSSNPIVHKMKCTFSGRNWMKKKQKNNNNNKKRKTKEIKSNPLTPIRLQRMIQVKNVLAFLACPIDWTIGY